MSKFQLYYLVIFAAFAGQVQASEAHWDNQIVDPIHRTKVSLSHVVGHTHPGQIIILSEDHDSVVQHQHQVAFLAALSRMRPGLAVSVGMEFFEYPYQSEVDSYMAGRLAEPEFLKSIDWGKIDFSLYREQVIFPSSHGGKTHAINLPRKIAHRIAEGGLGGLTPDEQAYLPPRFQMGNALYRERVYNELKQSHGDIPPEMLEQFFEAQSAWDDTMAFQTVNVMKANPQQILFILVGNVHAEYGGGLPDRMKARGLTDVLVIPQLNAARLTSDELLRALNPDKRYGPRGRYIWVNGEPRKDL